MRSSTQGHPTPEASLLCPSHPTIGLGRFACKHKNTSTTLRHASDKSLRQLHAQPPWKCNLLAQTRNVPATTMKTADQTPSESCPATSGAPRTFSPSVLARMQGGLKVSQAPSCPAVRQARLTHATPTLSLRDLLLSPCDPHAAGCSPALFHTLVFLDGCGSLPCPQRIPEEAVHNACPLQHSDKIYVVEIREDELTIGQMALHYAGCCPSANKRGIMASPCSTPSPCTIVCMVPASSSRKYLDGVP